MDDLKQKCAQLTAQMKQQKEESRNLADQIVVENNRLLALQTEVERKSDQKQILEA